MTLFFQILFYIILGTSCFILGWICRSCKFVNEKDCANPLHRDWDYRKEKH